MQQQKRTVQNNLVNLIKLIEKVGSRPKVAKVLGCSASQVNMLMNNERELKPKLSKLIDQRLAEAESGRTFDDRETGVFTLEPDVLILLRHAAETSGYSQDRIASECVREAIQTVLIRFARQKRDAERFLDRGSEFIGSREPEGGKES